MHDKPGTEDAVDDSTEDHSSMDHFLTPDAHPLYASVKHMQSEAGDWHARGTNVRARMRGGRQMHVKGRGRSCHGHGDGHHQYRNSTWQVGRPIQEIWVTDDDVPHELRELAREVMRRRQERAKVLTGSSTRKRKTQEDEDSLRVKDEEVCNDFAQEVDATMLGSDDLHFEWSPMESFPVGEEKFRPQHTGIVSQHSNVYETFRSFWDDEILQMIVNEANSYATTISSTRYQTDWYPTNSDEVLCVFAFWIMSGIIRMPTICSYFSKNALLKVDIFGRITSSTRYASLYRALHFVESCPTSNAAFPTSVDIANFDRTDRLTPIIDALNSKFQSQYILSKDICINESMITFWKGKQNLKEYIRSKATYFGIKTYELCESTTGYLWSFLLHAGKSDQSEQENDPSQSTSVALKLIKPLLNKGYRLFMDIWFNSPILARFLKRNGTDCVGTLRPSREHVPPLVTQAPLKQGQFIARHSGDVCVISWQDNKRVNMITTCHGSATGLPTVASRPIRKLPYKPQAVLDYDVFMGGAHHKDMMFEPYLLEPYLLEEKRCAKWCTKLFKRLLNCSIQNTRVLLESSSGTRLDNLQLRLELVQAILDHHLHLTPYAARRNNKTLTPSPFPYILTHTHWPVLIPPTAYEQSRNRQGRRICVVCHNAKKITRTPFKCQECDVALCMDNCYKIYHTTPRRHDDTKRK